MTYMKTDERREQVLTAALKLAVGDHYRAITREQIADQAQTATGNINRVFGTMVDLRSELVAHAIEQECLPVIAQAIAVNDRAVAGVPNALKRRALQGLL